jgi:hypothetical protein
MTEVTPDPHVHLTTPPKRESVWEVYFPVRPDEDKEAVPVASFPMIIYFWPTMIAFLMCGTFQSFGWWSEGALGWIAVLALAFNLMVIVTNLDQKKFVILMLSLMACGLGVYIARLQNWAIIGDIGDWVASFHVTMSTAAYWLIGLFLLAFFFVGMAQPRFNYWRLEPNEFVHYIQPWGRDQSFPRQGSTVTREVPDLLEWFLTFGGGTLVIRREGQVVARIEHVPFLGRRMRAIERLLGVTRVKAM